MFSKIFLFSIYNTYVPVPVPVLEMFVKVFQMKMYLCVFIIVNMYGIT